MESLENMENIIDKAQRPRKRFHLIIDIKISKNFQIVSFYSVFESETKRIKVWKDAEIRVRCRKIK